MQVTHSSFAAPVKYNFIPPLPPKFILTLQPIML